MADGDSDDTEMMRIVITPGAEDAAALLRRAVDVAHGRSLENAVRVVSAVDVGNDTRCTIEVPRPAKAKVWAALTLCRERRCRVVDAFDVPMTRLKPRPLDDADFLNV